MKRKMKLTVNGEVHSLEIEPHRTLLSVLREELELKGAKEGCGQGYCGACTVLLEGQPVCSCCLLAMDARGREIVTVEGLSVNGELHPLQQSFIEQGAIQCGYCTPGMLLSAKALLDENPSPSEEDIRSAISGNLCRCTGYVKIVKAIRAAAEI
jgi:carbon-monoxide dehydrogenase small subunit